LGVALALACAVTPEFAAPATANPLPSAAQILDTFNLVTTGDVSTNSDIEGSAVIGGNLSASTFFNNNAPGTPVIYLYGTQSGNLNLNNGGSLYMDGSPGGQVNYNGGGHLYSSGPPLPLSDYTAPLAQLSSTLASLAANSSISVASNSVTFNAVAGANGVAVFDVTAAQLESELASNIVFSQGAGVTGVVVNVTGNFAEPGGVNWNQSPQQDVLFNFTGATSVNVGNWQASILAPGATVGILNGNINGSVFAGNYTGGGELHNYTYTGTLPSDPSVPEPATLGIFGLGLAGLAALRRRPR
jgi:choice-of-anchor A domain-containing protein